MKFNANGKRKTAFSAHCYVYKRVFLLNEVQGIVQKDSKTGGINRTGQKPQKMMESKEGKAQRMLSLL